MIPFSVAAVKILLLSLALSIFIIMCLFVFVWSLLASWMCGLKFFMRFTQFIAIIQFFFFSFCSFCLSGNLIMGVMGNLMVSRVV